MKYFALISTLLVLAACNQMSNRTNRVTDSSAGMQLIPRDSFDHNMVIPTDTTASNIPTVDPDASKVQPK